MKQGILSDGCSPNDYLNFAVSSSHGHRQIVRVRDAIEYPNLELMVRGEGVHALLPNFEGSMEEAVALYRSIGTRGGKTFGELEAEGVPALAIRIEPLVDLPAADEGVPALAIRTEPLEDLPAADEVSPRARLPIPSRHITSHPSHHPIPSHPVPSCPVLSRPIPPHPIGDGRRRESLTGSRLRVGGEDGNP